MYRIRQIYLKVLLLGLAAFAFVACQQDEMQPERGGFSLCLSQFEEVVTRATPAELGKPLASQFKLHIQNTRTDYVMYDGQFQEFVEAYKGNYSIVATYGDNAQLAVDKPYYRGEAQAAIDSEGQTTPVNLTCKVANALVSVRFQDTDELKFAEQFSEYYLRVTQGNLYYNLADEAKSVYFRAGGMPKLQFRAVRKTGEEVVLDVESTALPKNAEAAQHFIVTLGMTKTDAQVEPMVSKIAVETVTIFDTVPVEWLPAPKVLSPDVVGFIDNVSVADDMDAVLSFSAARPMQDLELTLQFDAPALASLNGTYVLSTLTAEQRSTLAQYGVVLPEAGTTTGSVDLRSVIPAIYNQGHDTSSPVTLRVKANNRWGGKTVTMVVTRPVYTMHKQAEGNAWSKSIYIDPVAAEDVATDIEGLGAKVAKHMSYQISSDGGATWADIATPVTDGKPMASGRSVDSDYMIRGCIAGTNIYSTDASAYHTEAEVAVPNGDFESLMETINIVDMNQGGRYHVLALDYQTMQTLSISEPIGWGSLNPATCNYAQAAVKNTWYVVPSTFNTNCSATYRTEDQNGVKIAPSGDATRYEGLSAQNGSNAMVLQNVAWSLNGVVPSTSSNKVLGDHFCLNVPSGVEFSRTAGQLFLQDELGEGNGFSTRPTQLNFYYTYSGAQNGEQAVVNVEVLAGDVVIANSVTKLSMQSGYMVVHVPLQYSIIDLKATRVRIKFISSDASNIQTTNYTSFVQCSYGASLQVDNLTFTYGK